LQPPAQSRKPEVAGIADMAQLPEMSEDEYDAAEESNDLSDLCVAEGKPPNC